jgi:hypothetical protein
LLLNSFAGSITGDESYYEMSTRFGNVIKRCTSDEGCCYRRRAPVSIMCFGPLAQMGGKLVRCLGIVHTTFALHLKAAR